MAQILREGCTFSLIAEESTNENRKVYFVKLTDSCLKAIEEYTDDFLTGSKMKSIIRFDDANRGAVIIPNSSIKDIKKTFSFAISNVITSDTNPLQECIKCNRTSNQLLSYGPLEQKISIAATDDCYQNTRNRMAQVDQERKDIRTKEIKLGSMKKGKKSLSKTVVTENHNKSTKSIKTVVSENHNKSTKSIKTVVTENHNKSTKPPIRKINPHRPTIPTKPSSALSSTTHASSPVLKKSPSKDSPKPISNVNSPSSISGTKEFTCKDRVLHILSLRPHKKAELITRLQREGMTQKERCSLPMILQQVASHNDNQYTLHPNLFVHLQVETWPFFNENERNIVKQNIIASKKTESTSSQHVSSTSKSPEEKSSLKRPLPPKPEYIPKKTKVESNGQSAQPSLSSKENLAAVSSTSDKNKSKGQDSPQIVASTSDSPEYLSVYKSITSNEQRYQYKRDFQLEYEEYIKIKKYLDSRRNKYLELKMLLSRTEVGTPEYNKIEKEILTTYQQHDENYGKSKCRYEELTKKLGHIKQLVVEYDNSIGNS